MKAEDTQITWLASRSEAERKQAPQSEANVCRKYSQLPLRRTPLGPAISVRLRDMSVL